MACSLAYWLQAFPAARREIRRWRERADAIPDPRLHELALATQCGERGNLEGAAAFAVLAPPRRRAAVARAAIAFQAAYDYVDTLAEQPCSDPEKRARRLHLVLLAALDERRASDGARRAAPEAGSGEVHGSKIDPTGLDPGKLAPDEAGSADGGYLLAMVERCQAALRELPSYPLVRSACLRATARMVRYQSYTHAAAERREAMDAWASSLVAPASGLRWWESAAGAASSLSVFALIAAAARPGLTAAQAQAVEHAYFPHAGALHVLLDSLLDSDADRLSGHHSLVSHYASAEVEAQRLALLAQDARAGLCALPQGHRHEAVLAAMACFYLAGCTATQQCARRAVLAQLGPVASAAMAVLRLRRALSRGLRAAVGHETQHAVRILESQVVDFPLVAARDARR